MLFRKIIAVYREDHMKHMNTLRGQNVALLSITKMVHIINCVFQKVNKGPMI
jgi:hypothetical protein